MKFNYPKRVVDWNYHYYCSVFSSSYGKILVRVDGTQIWVISASSYLACEQWVEGKYFHNVSYNCKAPLPFNPKKTPATFPGSDEFPPNRRWIVPDKPKSLWKNCEDWGKFRRPNEVLLTFYCLPLPMIELLGLATLCVAKTYYNQFSCFFFIFHYDFTNFNTEYRKYTVNKKKKEHVYFYPTT